MQCLVADEVPQENIVWDGSLTQMNPTLKHFTDTSLLMAALTKPFTVWHPKPLPHTLDIHSTRLPPQHGIVSCLVSQQEYSSQSLLHLTVTVFPNNSVAVKSELMPEETSEVLSQMKMQLAKVLDRKQRVCFGTFLVLFLLPLCYVSPNPQITVVFKLVP